MPIQTIDEVISCLEEIIAKCIKEKNTAGYFAALYYKVTCAVKEGIKNGDYEDGPRMERLDVLFASRYINAWNAWQNNQPTTGSWDIAFKKIKNKLTLILQHLLLGINAHINLDLGIAAVQTMDNKDLHPLRRDFIRINALLSSLMLDVLKDLNRISPLTSLLGLHAKNSKSMILNFTIESARDGAWCFAQDLSALSGTGSVNFIKERDIEIQKLGFNLSVTKGLMWITAMIIRLFEWNNAAKVIEVLKDSKKIKLKQALETP
jgi:hypothetical protein